MRTKVVTDREDIGSSAERREVRDLPLGLSMDEFFELSQSIVIMIPHRPTEGIPPTLANSLYWWGVYSTSVMLIPDQFGGFIEHVRGGMAEEFLKHCADFPKKKYAVMIDADQGVAHDAPYRLAFWDKPLVSGVVCSYNERRGVWGNFTMKDKSGVARFPSHAFTKKMPSRGLIEVESCGTGLLCVRKDVLERLKEEGERPFMIPQDIREQSYDVGTMKYGEDIAFSRQVRKYGFDIHVDLSVHADHYKTMAVTWPKFAIDHELDPADWEVAVEDYHHG
jgi:hypothetical protein